MNDEAWRIAWREARVKAGLPLHRVPLLDYRTPEPGIPVWLNWFGEKIFLPLYHIVTCVLLAWSFPLALWILCGCKGCGH